MKPILVIGGGGHARVVIDIIQVQGSFDPVGVVDGGRSGSVDGVPVVGDDSSIGMAWENGVRHAIVAIGATSVRLRIAAELEARGFVLPALVHPAATVARRAELGPGTVVMAGAVVNPGSIVGALAIVNTKASVDHDNELGIGVHVAPGATLCGTVRAGDRSWMGAGCTVREGVTIGSDCFIAAGAVVVADAPSGALLRGVPARQVAL